MCVGSGLFNYLSHAGLDPASRNVLLLPTLLNASIFWIPAFAGTTILLVWTDHRKALDVGWTVSLSIQTFLHESYAIRAQPVDVERHILASESTIFAQNARLQNSA